LDHRGPLKAGRGALYGQRLVRQLVAPLAEDRVLSTDISALAAAIEQGHFSVGTA
jgi:histidine ammonia-lyase